MLMAGSMSLAAQDFHITRLKYPGGGDWYANPSSLPNFITFIAENTNIPIDPNEYRTELTDGDLYNHPFLYMNGHGNVRFTDEEVRLLRDYLISGGFLHADDNYGMDESFRRQMKRVFPKKELVELPWDHPIFHTYFDFPKGCPKIHEHDGKPAQLLGLFDKGRLIVVYSYQSDLGDGWEDLEVHNDGPAKHEAALKMGTNIVVYAMTH
ncbi:MAG: hypothetical protein COY19_04650 [Candidatus Marinimicrobia bacterium CG_4_10_14_0_2_um_filter_48_9]|nr:MAG: hypothetical protein COY19_04650 [Candidatus Marinimicrobia bacterium CG_4_10_14_0_2_um_filter_48_9]